MTGRQLDLTPFTTTLCPWPFSQFFIQRRVHPPKSGAASFSTRLQSCCSQHLEPSWVDLTGRGSLLYWYVSSLVDHSKRPHAGFSAAGVGESRQTSEGRHIPDQWVYQQVPSTSDSPAMALQAFWERRILVQTYIFLEQFLQMASKRKMRMYAPQTSSVNGFLQHLKAHAYVINRGSEARVSTPQI